MPSGWLEEVLASQPSWHVSSLEIPSGPFGAVPVSLRVVAAPRDPVHLGKNVRPAPEQLFAPRVMPLVLIVAVPQAGKEGPNLDVVERFKQRLQLPGLVVQIGETTGNVVSDIRILADQGAYSGGDGAALASWVNQAAANRGVSLADATNHKTLNTGHVNDLLHAWSRSLLSSDLIVNDIDAVCFRGREAPLSLVEIKRTAYVPWRPYSADASNYALLRALSMGADKGVLDVTLHYDPKREQPPYEVTPHFVVGTAHRTPVRTIGFGMAPISDDTRESAATKTARWVEAWTDDTYWSAN